MFGELIIMIVYLPILALEGVEGKLFRPMALTVIFALAGSMVLSLTLMPVLASLMLPKRIDEREPLVIRVLKRLYAPVLRFTMHHKLAVLGFALCLLVVAFGMIAPNLGSEFIPKLSEGSIVVNIVRLAGIDLEESIRYNTQMEKALLAAFPDEILYAWSRIGTAEVATDPMGVELSDIFITLKPREQWKRAQTQDELTELIQKELRDLPGQRIAMTQPIEMRLNEMISGRSLRRGRHSLRRRLRRAGEEGRRDRAGSEVDSRRGRREHRTGHGAAGSANPHQPGRNRPLRHPGQHRARPGGVLGQQAFGRSL